MPVQGSTLEPCVSCTQLKEDQLKQGIIKKDTNLPIGGSGFIPVEFSSFQMELGLVSDSVTQVQELEINREPLKQKSLLQKSPLQGLLQWRSSVEEWKRHFDYSNYVSNQDTFAGCWHNYKMVSCSKVDLALKKPVVKRQPLKHKSLLQKSKLIHGKSKGKSQEWIKEILRVKRDTSNLLVKSKLNCRQGKSEANSGEWIKSILSNSEENSSWVRIKDFNCGFKCKQFPDTAKIYDMKALTDECENMQKEKQMTRKPRGLPYDFHDLIQECENLKGEIFESRTPPYVSRCQNSSEVNANELAGYMDNILQIPREMSAMAKAMYT
ncbi:hypothetical protein KR059_011726 [Drosophila kikkawai]|nr:hypothetical protein KR059_011726 [Drosophila kikkawai]